MNAARQEVARRSQVSRMLAASAALQLAEIHEENGAAMQSSAVLCVEASYEAFFARNFEVAAQYAVRALAYSVGIFHEDYKQAQVLAARVAS